MRQILITICLFFSVLKLGNGQSFFSKVSVGIGPSVMIPNSKAPGALGISIQPTYHFAYNGSISAVFEAGISSIGQNEKFTPSSPSINAILDYYDQLETSAKWRRKTGISLIFSPRFLQTKLFFEIGGGHYWQKETFLKRYKVANEEFLLSDIISSVKGPGYFSSIGAEFDRIKIGVSSNKIKNIESYNSFYIVYHINKVKIDPWFEQKILKAIPTMMLEIGLQHTGFSKNRSLVRKFFVEPKFSIYENITLGFKYTLSTLSKNGYGKERDWIMKNGRLKSFPKNDISKVDSKICFLDYYHRTNDIWVTLGIGGGIFTQEKYVGEIGRSLNYQIKEIHEIKAQKNYGLSTRIGLKSGIARTSLEYNFTGKNIPNYFSLNLGFEIGL